MCFILINEITKLVRLKLLKYGKISIQNTTGLDHIGHINSPYLLDHNPF